MNHKQDIYVLVKLTERRSVRNGGNYWLISWLDTRTGKILETSVDPLYDNWKNWQTVVNSRRPLGLYDNLSVSKRTTRDGTQIISADSLPCQIEALDESEIYLLVEAVLERA